MPVIIDGTSAGTHRYDRLRRYVTADRVSRTR